MHSIQAMGQEVNFDIPTSRVELKVRSQIRFFQDDQSNISKLTGIRPCARDGHTANIFKDRLIIFGGDRHKMTFQDIYIYNLMTLLDDVSPI